MSRSTPAKTTSKAPATLSEQLTRMTPREWLLSGALHVTALALLIWLTPVHAMIAKAIGGTQKSHASGDDSSGNDEASQLMKDDPDRVREVVKSIEATQADKARAMVSGMLDSEKKLDEMAKQKVEAFHKEEQQRAAAAAKTALDQLRPTPQEQQAALDNQKKLADQVHALADKAVEAQKTADPAALKPVEDALPPIENEMTKAQDAIAQAQSDTAQKQAAAAQPLDDAKAAMPATVATQKEALDAQKQAIDRQQQAIWQQKEALSVIENLIRQAQEVTRLKNATAQQQADVDQQTARENQARQALDAANKVLQAANQTASAAPAQAAQVAASQKHDTTQQKLTDSRNALEQNQNDLKSVTDELASIQSSLAALTAKLDSDQQASRDAQTAAAQKQTDAINQLNATLAQNPATETADNADTLTGTDSSHAAPPGANAPPPGAPPQPASTSPRDPSTNAAAPHGSSSSSSAQNGNGHGHGNGSGNTPAASLDGKTLAQLYQVARDTEKQIAQKYKTYRAAELAGIEGISLDEAMRSVEVAQPNREPVDVAALSAQNAAGHFEAYKAQVMQANQQIASMMTLGQSMLETALAQQHVGDGTLDASHLLQDQAQNFQKMKALALADKNSRGKDLTGLMGSSINNGDYPKEGLHNKGEVYDPSSHIVPEVPSMDYHDITPYATRRFSDHGPHHADWLYVDSWYLIGPFPDDDRSNLTTRFPPESIVDLDATYVGKYGEPIRWKYTQWNSPMLRPDHDIEDAPAVYYAYTELDFDQDRDLWVATGTDDSGKIWINNVLIWDSGDVLTAWRPDQGYRKVHFSKGRNRILYRIENGRVVAAFSLMISTREQ